MQQASQAISKSRLWTGRILSTILVLFLLFDAIAKLLRLAPVLQAFDQLGWSRNLAIPLGIVLLACTLLYMIPNSSALGALLLTAYLGGAVATHLRAGEHFISPLSCGYCFGWSWYCATAACGYCCRCRARTTGVQEITSGE
jgi:DoxX-like family